MMDMFDRAIERTLALGELRISFVGIVTRFLRQFATQVEAM